MVKLAHSTEDYLVREAKTTEYAETGILTYQGFDHHLQGSPAPSPERAALLLDAELRARTGTVLVLEHRRSSQLVGTASLLPSDSPLARQAVSGEVELRFLAVLGHARGSGLGAKLLEHSAALAASSGAKYLVLDTAVDNVRAQALYVRFGFVRQLDRERPRPVHLVQLVVYTLDLAPYRLG
ncbi:GNAT family N-acetyltransferase [Arthrobacter sp. GMC3]|uniref:GNAT family N-acetyltransferase n=1 Tax=Arthrobacter sp. GMC3 TaxID=2058894 RepID=UPI000CE46EC5|nr:GNAT family N-acetyltransferase [Arthrobacter sp. GMC3]